MPSSRMSYHLAWRFFRGGEKDGLVSLISGVSTIGMTIAVALLIVVLSVMNGFDREFRSRILALSPHADVKLSEPLLEWGSVVSQLRLEDSVISVHPYNKFEAMALSGRDVVPLLVHGMQLMSRWQQYGRFVDFGSSSNNGQGARSVLEQTLPSELGSRDIIVGAGLAKKLKLEIGETLKLLKVEQSANGSERGNTKVIGLRVAGLIKTGTQADNNVGIMSLAAAGALNGRADYVEGFHFQFDNIFSARERAFALASQYSLDGRLSDWTREFGNLYMAIQLSRQLVVMLVATIVAIAVFNVFVTLGMVVRHKYREIAILRTLGLGRNTVLKTFVWQGLFIALPGCIAGVIVGYILATLLPEAVAWIQQLAGVELLNTEVYPIDYLPSEVLLSDILFIVAIALAMSLIATLGPAWKASKMQPVRVLNRDQ